MIIAVNSTRRGDCGIRRTEEFTMHSGRIQDNVYANSRDFNAQRIEKRTKTKEPPADKNPQGWVIITLVVLLILMFLILLIFTSLLFVFYKSITDEQSHLNSDVKELNSQLENNEQETNNNFTIEISHLRSNVKELTSELKKSKEETDSELKQIVSTLKESVANLTDDLKKIKNENIQDSCTSCPSGWQLIKSNCYYFQANGETWERSRVICETLNGDILILKDKAELDSLLPAIGNRRYWIGLRRDNKNINNWLWADGNRLTFSAWNAGEPNNEHNSEHCAEILGGPKSMNDRNCEDNIGYICKRAWTC
ncbi:uncharacterized protein [Aquarana catesbeiana]|uniref:uncharacterized protein n=1 Tax=Aquarana catesbeiana TaxID=8400 RepID=UPI003CC96388